MAEQFVELVNRCGSLYTALRRWRWHRPSVPFCAVWRPAGRGTAINHCLLHLQQFHIASLLFGAGSMYTTHQEAYHRFLNFLLRVRSLYLMRAGRLGLISIHKRCCHPPESP